MANLMRQAAERASSDEFFLASVLLPYASMKGLSDQALADRLGCARGDLSRLLLCRRPRAEGLDFREDVQTIARAFSIDPLGLAEIIRLADAAVAFGRHRQPDARGWLAAARDRESEPDENGS